MCCLPPLSLLLPCNLFVFFPPLLIFFLSDYNLTHCWTNTTVPCPRCEFDKRVKDVPRVCLYYILLFSHIQWRRSVSEFKHFSWDSGFDLGSLVFVWSLIEPHIKIIVPWLLHPPASLPQPHGHAAQHTHRCTDKLVLFSIIDQHYRFYLNSFFLSSPEL